LRVIFKRKHAFSLQAEAFHNERVPIEPFQNPMLVLDLMALI